MTISISRTHLPSVIAVAVSYSWIERLIGCRDYESFAKRGYCRWEWDWTGKAVSKRISAAIDAAIRKGTP